MSTTALRTSAIRGAPSLATPYDPLLAARDLRCFALQWRNHGEDAEQIDNVPDAEAPAYFRGYLPPVPIRMRRRADGSIASWYSWIGRITIWHARSGREIEWRYSYRLDRNDLLCDPWVRSSASGRSS